MLSLIAPRPCLIVSPMHDRHADLDEIKACVEKARAFWEDKGAGSSLTHQMPDDYNRFQSDQQTVFVNWISMTAKHASQ